MEEPPQLALNFFLSILRSSFTFGDWITIVICLFLIFLLVVGAALFSSSENALFSMKKNEIEEISEDETRTSKAIVYLLTHPKKLLATILIANTFVNVAVVMVSTLLFTVLFNFHENPILGFLMEVVLVTFMLVLFGEVIPKIIAVQNHIRVSRFISIPVFVSYKILQPLVYVLENSTSIIDKRITKRGHILSVDELSHAIDITSSKTTPKQEKSILKGIVNFSTMPVKQIMRQRPDISGIEIKTSFTELLKMVNELAYSRYPVYDTNLDRMQGILFTKDLLPYINEEGNFKWQGLLRGAYFVPETKKIDDLLKDFQSKRTHLAIVVDEFGGTSGLVTMEDILEEIFGEIDDEFDDDEVVYSRINEDTFVFEAKLTLNDICKYMEIDPDVFDKVKNEADTLGGMLLELSGDLPKEGQEIVFKNFTFNIEAVDKRRIKRVRVHIKRVKEAVHAK